MEDENYYTESDDDEQEIVYEHGKLVPYYKSDKFILDSDPNKIPIRFNKTGIYSYIINNKLTNSQIIQFLENVTRNYYSFNSWMIDMSQPRFFSNNGSSLDLSFINQLLGHKIDEDKLNIIYTFLENLKEKAEEQIYKIKKKYIDVTLVTKHRTLENIHNPDMLRLIESYTNDEIFKSSEREELKFIFITIRNLNERIEDITFLQSLINEKIYKPQEEFECVVQ